MAKKHRLEFKIVQEYPTGYYNVAFNYRVNDEKGFPLISMSKEEWNALKRIAHDSNGRIVVRE